MIPKVEACLETLERGVHKVHIIDGRLRHSLLLEIYTTQGVGTQIVRDDVIEPAESGELRRPPGESVQAVCSEPRPPLRVCLLGFDAPCTSTVRHARQGAITMASIESTSSAATVALFQKYVIPNYGRYPVNLVRGEGLPRVGQRGQPLPGSLSRLGLQPAGALPAAGGRRPCRSRWRR